VEPERQFRQAGARGHQGGRLTRGTPNSIFDAKPLLARAFVEATQGSRKQPTWLRSPGHWTTSWVLPMKSSSGGFDAINS